MTALAPAFRSVDYIAGLNLNYRKCCWVQYDTEERESLRTWISENCEEFREMQNVRHAKHVGTMIGPDGHIHRWTAHQKKFIQRVLKINASTTSLVERLCDFKIYAIPVLSFIGSVCASDKATLKAQNHALQCATAGPYNAIPSTLLGFSSVCGLGPDLVGIHSISLAARYRVAACLTTLSQGLEKIKSASGHNCTPIFALSPIWKKEFLVPFMACSTADAFDVVCRLDRNGTLDEAPQNKEQKVASGLLLDKLHKQAFAGPLSSRASRVLGPISRYRVADIDLHLKLVSRASRPGLLVGFLRILCNGLGTAQRFHTEEHDHTCCVRCPNEPDSLSHYNECPQLYNIFTSFWRRATVLPQRNHFLLDLITRVFLRSLQYGIVVMGFLDAFVYAHHQHRQGF